MEYTQPELYAALASYLETEEQLVADAEAEVVSWKYANDQMLPIPLGDVIGFRGDRWHPSTLQWFNETPAGICYTHGFDRSGNLRLIKSLGRPVVVFHRAGDILDEIHFEGDERSRFTRHIVQDGVTRVRFVCHQYRLEYDREEFEFVDNRCVGSVVRGFYLDDESNQWVETSWTTIYRYEYDDQGLLCVYCDQGEYLGNNRLVYRRPGSDPELSAKARARRPIVAYSIELPQGEEARHQAVYGDAYGLEMTIDNEYPIDTILLTLPDFVSVITGCTDVTSMGTVFPGSSEWPADGNLAQLVAHGAKWLMLDAASSNVMSALKACLGTELCVILRVVGPLEIAAVLEGVPQSSSSQVVIAVGQGGPLQPDDAQAEASSVRRQLQALGMSQTRVAATTHVDEQNILEYLKQPDIDGVLMLNSDFGTVVKTLQRIALHCA